MMATSRNVWLPGAAVWACLPQSSEAVSSPARRDDASLPLKGKIARCHDRELHEELPRKRRKDSRPSSSREDLALEVENSFAKPKSLALMDARADAPGLGLRIESRIRGDDQGASSSQEVVMCPICLGNIEETGGAVLQWCMHRFCAHCIEEWSRVRRLCPLCKAEYRGWYYGVQSNSEFQERILPPIAEPSKQLTRGDTAASHAFSRFHVWRDSRRQERGRGRMPPRRQGVAPVTAAAASSSQTFGRSVPFPTQRSFGLPRQHQGAQAMKILEEQAAAKALQWRLSIYNRNLIACPFELRKKSTGTKDANARAERRLEPWVRRELQAVLPNSDHNFLVRLVLGLWFGAEHEAIHIPERPGRSGGPHMTSTRNATGSTEVEGAVEKAIKELKRFLGDKAEVFWHELRCFAESPFTMQAYDTIVVYNRHDNSRRPINRVNRRSSYQDRPMHLRRGSESDIPRLTSMPLHNEDSAHLENNHQIFRAGRHTTSHTCAVEGVHGSLVQQQQDTGRDSSHSSQALLTRNSRADQRKRRQHMDVIPIAEHRWQLSYC